MMRNLPLLYMIIATLGLTACVSNPSYIKNEPLQLSEGERYHQYAADALPESSLRAVADDIRRQATSDVTVMVEYASSGNSNALQVAQAQGTKVKSFLQQNGVRQSIIVQTDPSLNAVPNIITIKYAGMEAYAGCDNWIDRADSALGDLARSINYRYGCTNDYYLSRQIAYPDDLLGDASTSPATSQRLGRSQALYNSGERITAPEDEGLTASDVYSN